ncbi:MAG: hypothetical protein ACYDB2_10605 [Acidimicrobiales bacterium]
MTRQRVLKGPRFVVLSLAVVVLVLAGTTTAVLLTRSPSPKVGPEGVVVLNVPDLAPANTTLSGVTIDAITCRPLSKETVKYHVHVHVAIYVNGHPERLPAGIGITKPFVIQHYASGPFVDVGLYDCLYWLHTHVADGIIHVEAPTKQSFTLGQFFDVWGQPLGRNQVGPAKGKVVVYENGKQLTGDPRLTPLTPHGDIQIDVGSPAVAFQPFSFKVAGACGQGTLSCSTTTTK